MSARRAAVRDADLADALEHASDYHDRELRIEDFDVSQPEQIAIRSIPDDLSSWAEWRPGELLRDFDDEGRFFELASFRGRPWAERASSWTPSTMPPIVLVETSDYEGVGDGRGRVSYAIGMGWPTVPAMRVVERKRAAYAENPPWVDALLRKHGAALAAYAGSPMPEPTGRKYKELGCGHYGCVLSLPTPGTVLKVTSDPSEAAFVAAYFEIGHPHPGIVRYDRIVELPETYRRRRTFAIWRQEAHNVGKSFGKPLDRYAERYGERSLVEFFDNLRNFKEISTIVRHIIQRSESPTSLLDKARALRDWAWREVDSRRRPECCALSQQRLAFRLRQLEMIAEEMANTHAGYLIGQAFEFYIDQGILLADVHIGNIGEVVPPEHSSWEIVITDPGHMVPLDPRWLQVEIPQLYG